MPLWPFKSKSKSKSKATTPTGGNPPKQNLKTTQAAAAALAKTYAQVVVAQKQADAAAAQFIKADTRIDELEDTDYESDTSITGPSTSTVPGTGTGTGTVQGSAKYVTKLKKLQDELALAKQANKDAQDNFRDQYAKLELKEKIGHKIYSRLLKYFRADIENGVVGVSYTRIVMALFCLLIFLYCIILQVTIIARTVDASYIDKNGSTSESKPDYTSSFPRSSYAKPALSKTKFNPALATAFKKNTRTTQATSTSKHKRDYQTHGLSMIRIVRTRPTVAPTKINHIIIEFEDPSAITSTASPQTLPPNVDALYKEVGFDASTRPTPFVKQLVPRKAHNNKSPATDLSASCLYYNGSGLAKQGPFAVALNVISELWYLVILFLFLLYENLRLRINRKTHSAAVLGAVQAWLGVEYLTKGVEAQLVVAAIGLYIIAFINLFRGIPQVHRNRESLFSSLIAKPDLYSVPTAGRSYAVPAKKGKFLASASEVVKMLNQGIDEESQALGKTPKEMYAARITQYNAPLVNLKPYDSLPRHILLPSTMASAGFQSAEVNKAKYGYVPRSVERQIPGGLDDFQSILAGTGADAIMNRMALQFLDPKRINASDKRDDSGIGEIVRLNMLSNVMQQSNNNTGLPQYPANAFFRP